MLGAPLAGYLLLLLLFFLFFSASLYFGYREWRRPSDAAPLAMDVEYIRVEDYFGRSFRAKMQEWLAEAQPNGVAAGELSNSLRRVTPGGEHLLLLQGGRIGNGEGQQEIVWSEGDLTLADGAVFRREIYCQGSLETEAGVRLQSVAADGNLVLGAYNDVARWVDAQGTIAIRRGTAVGSRVSSGVSIELEPEVSVQSLYAPVVSTAGSGVRPEAGETPDAEESAFLPAAPSKTDGPGADKPAKPPFLEGLRCAPLEPGSWLVQGDLHLPAGTRVEDSLIVKGTLQSGSQCVFLKDVKAVRFELGEANRVYGNLTAEDCVQVGSMSFVARNVTAGSDVRLASGVTVGRPQLLAVLSAAGEIILEPNVTVCGKLTASRWVRTI